MNTCTDKIEAAKIKAAEKLAAEIAEIERDAVLREYAPNSIEIKRTSGAGWDGVSDIRYEVKTAHEVAAIITAWHEKTGDFMPVGQYSKSCSIVTAYPCREYLEPEALKNIEDDAIEARNSKGKGFSSVEFCFYPKIEGEKIKVTIDLAFRCFISGFEGIINADYNNRGDVVRVEKRAPVAYSGAAFRVNFGGGSEDSADWRAVFNRAALLTALEAHNGN